MLPYLDVVLYVRMINGVKSLIAIKRKGDMEWWHFEQPHWDLTKHPLWMQAHLTNYQIRRKNTRVPLKIESAYIKNYYDEGNSQFKFATKELRCG